ncbi:MAG: hypothetical protein H7641_02360 [Candidatus Heimdallarchaeota archaeon]|nr:hypothetical protein [Candidatus Heimdallarchaeota archaeon]MCK4876407.1 hypothetical protein [Candidatus Heimdallarchaeota archaeon]
MLKSVKKKHYLLLLAIFVMILSPAQIQAAEKSKSVHDENGMKITISCRTNTSYISENFRVNLSVELSKKPDNVIELFKVYMYLREIVNGTEIRSHRTVNFAYIDGSFIRNRSTLMNFRDTWIKAKIQIQLKFFVDKTGTLPSLAMKTEWLDFVTLRNKGSFARNFDWAFIIFGVGSVIGVGLVLYKKFL